MTALALVDVAPSYGAAMSIEEWEALPEDVAGEIADGRLVEEEVADGPHEIVVSALLFVLLSWARPRGGRVLASETKYALSKRRGRKPDISMFVSRERKLPRRGATTHPPDLVVEVISPDPRDRRRDRVEKLREYAAFGVKQYWLVDPEAQTFEILTLDPAGHHTHVKSASEGLLEAPSFEGLSIDLDALWRELADEIEPVSSDNE